MANQLFQGYVYDTTGVAVVGATINLYDRNTTTPVRATTTTDATGLWTISHATEGRFDVEIVSGSAKRRIKYDTQLQFTTLEVATLRVRNPAFTFDYDIVPAAIVADRQLTLPLTTATETVAVLGAGGLAQTFANATYSAVTIGATDWATANHAHLAANSGGTIAGASQLIASNTTEATTTSVTKVTLFTLSPSPTIPAATPFVVDCVARKSGGAASAAGLGFELNSTVVNAASITTGYYFTSATDRAEDGMARALILPRVTNYLNGALLSYVNRVSSSGAAQASLFTIAALTNPMPNATITSILITGISTTSVTLGADEVAVYNLAVS